jgi:hypothetical protein
MIISILDLALALIIATAVCVVMCQYILFEKNDWKSKPEMTKLQEQMQADSDNPPDMIGLMHTKGDSPCGKIAFWYKVGELVAGRTILTVQDVEYLDGSTPSFDTAPVCNSCFSTLHNSGCELSLSTKAKQE